MPEGRQVSAALYNDETVISFENQTACMERENHAERLVALVQNFVLMYFTGHVCDVSPLRANIHQLEMFELLVQVLLGMIL